MVKYTEQSLKVFLQFIDLRERGEGESQRGREGRGNGREGGRGREGQGGGERKRGGCV